jgi:hypothetical protein
MRNKGRDMPEYSAAFKIAWNSRNISYADKKLQTAYEKVNRTLKRLGITVSCTMEITDNTTNEDE